MLNAIKKWFQYYTTRFYTDNPDYNKNVLLKADHCIRTARVSADIAFHEGFSYAEGELAQIIGLLHDIGRFEQYKQFHTFADHTSINHGILGENILRDSPCLKTLSADQQDLIYKSIRYHNCPVLPAHEEPAVLKFAALVRDADKIDIFRLSCHYFETRTEDNKNPTLELYMKDIAFISDNIFEKILSDSPAMMKDITTLDDFKALQMSWIFDINYKRAFEIIAERKSLQRLYNTISKDNFRARDVYYKAQLVLDQKIHPLLV